MLNPALTSVSKLHVSRLLQGNVSILRLESAVHRQSLYISISQSIPLQELYKEALDSLPEGATQQRAVLFANSAAARIKLEEFAEAAKDCSAALALEPLPSLQIKALTRRSLAYERLDDLDRAFADYEKVNFSHM